MRTIMTTPDFEYLLEANLAQANSASYGEEDIEVLDAPDDSLAVPDTEKDELTKELLQNQFGKSEAESENAVRNMKTPEGRDAVADATAQVLVQNYGMSIEDAAEFVAKYGDASVEDTLKAVMALKTSGRIGNNIAGELE